MGELESSQRHIFHGRGNFRNTMSSVIQIVYLCQVYSTWDAYAAPTDWAQREGPCLMSLSSPSADQEKTASVQANQHWRLARTPSHRLRTLAQTEDQPRYQLIVPKRSGKISSPKQNIPSLGLSAGIGTAEQARSFSRDLCMAPLASLRRRRLVEGSEDVTDANSVFCLPSKTSKLMPLRKGITAVLFCFVFWITYTKCSKFQAEHCAKTK